MLNGQSVIGTNTQGSGNAGGESGRTGTRRAQEKDVPKGFTRALRRGDRRFQPGFNPVEPGNIRKLWWCHPRCAVG